MSNLLAIKDFLPGWSEIIAIVIWTAEFHFIRKIHFLFLLTYYY